MAACSRPIKMGGCAEPNIGSAQHCLNQGEIFLFTQRVVRVARFAKKQEQWQEQLHPAMPRQQSAGGPQNKGELRFERGPDDPDGSTGSARHSWYRNDASRVRRRWQKPA